MIYIILFFFELAILYFLSRRVIRSVFRFFYQVTKRKSWTVYLFAAAFLPGTFIHEISHFLTALFLLVPVGELDLKPKFKDSGEGIDLGSVAIAKTDPIRRFLIGVAPFVFGVSIILTLLYFVSMNRFIETWWGKIVAGIIIFEVANSMFASKKDLEGVLVLFVFLLIVAAFIYVLGIRIPIDLANVSFSESSTKVLKNATLFLLVPIVIDALVIFLLKERRF